LPGTWCCCSHLQTNHRRLLLLLLLVVLVVLLRDTTGCQQLQKMRLLMVWTWLQQQAGLKMSMK